MRDIVIIGAGVTGSAVARELSRYQYDVLVVEANSDVCEGTSKANSGIVHAGFDTEPGSMMAKMNIRGNEMMEQLSKDLDFPFKRNGSLVLCFDEKDMDQLVYLLEKGQKNGVPGLRIITKEEVKEMEPNVTDDMVAALYAPTGGIVCPFGLNIAMSSSLIQRFRISCRWKVVTDWKLPGATLRQRWLSMRLVFMRISSIIWSVKIRLRLFREKVSTV